jgi:hypothetical protein
MDIDFNPEIHTLQIKEEYSLGETSITITRPAYGGLVFNDIRNFDPINTPVEEYESYYYLGFQFIFNIVDKPII